jgi:hypothetical protein
MEEGEAMASEMRSLHDGGEDEEKYTSKRARAREPGTVFSSFKYVQP